MYRRKWVATGLAAVLTLGTAGAVLANETQLAASAQAEARAEARAETRAEARPAGNAGGSGISGRTDAILAVSARLQSVMAEHEARGLLGAAANIQTTIDRLTAMAQAEGGAQTEAEALATVEAAIEARAEVGQASPEELDVKAEAEIKQGKKAEARATLLARLQAKPSTRHAYEVLLRLETEAGAHQELDTYVNGKKLGWDERPFIENGRTLVPIRKLVESLGAEVTWEAETQTVTILKGDVTIKMTVGAQLAVVNGEEVALDVPVKVVGIGRTVLPARFVSENLGLYVSWLAQYRTILVTETPVEG